MFRIPFVLPAVVLAAATVAGCTIWSPDEAEQPERSGPIQPVEAFEEVEEPRREMLPGREDPDGLSRDIERLQDARRKYEQERDRQAAEAQRRQEQCRQQEGSREVPIEDGSGDPVEFCQPDPETGQ